MAGTTDRVLGSSGNQFNAVFTDKSDNSEMDKMDFIKLMVAQMQNQDFTNPMDDTQMITQMAQFSNMQMMQEMAGYSKSNYAMSLVGKTVTASRFTVGGNLDTTTGMVQKVSMVDNEYVLYIGGKRYEMAQIMAVGGVAEGESLVDTTGKAIEKGEITSESISLKWQIPTEDEETASKLTYSLYYSTEGPFDKVEDVEKGNLVGLKGQKGFLEETIVGLDPDTTYYANVVVTDGNGVKSIYKPVEFKTTSNA